MNHSVIVGDRLRLAHLQSMSYESTIELLHTTTHLAVFVANTPIEREIVKLAGIRSQREGDSCQYCRHYTNPGIVHTNHEMFLLSSIVFDTEAETK